MITFTLPLPKSKPNSYKTNKKGAFYKDKKIKDNEIDIKTALKIQLPEAFELITTPINLTVQLYYNDKRRRDIDNPLKLLFDCCNGIIWKDDCQIERLYIEKHLGCDNNQCIVTVQ